MLNNAYNIHNLQTPNNLNSNNITNIDNDFFNRFNTVLEQSYSLFSRVEANMLNKSKRFNLSISELHLIAVINQNPVQGKLVGEIANDLFITPSSVTSAVNKLVKKGYVIKMRSLSDGRQTYIKLTTEGRHVDRIHKRFHKSLARSITGTMTCEEKSMLISCIDRMNGFLNTRLKKMEGLKNEF